MSQVRTQATCQNCGLDRVCVPFRMPACLRGRNDGRRGLICEECLGNATRIASSKVVDLGVVEEIEKIKIES